MTDRNLQIRRLQLGQSLFVSTLFLAIALTGATRSFAEDIGTLTLFQPNTPALAAEVNGNFDDVRTAVNSKQDESSAAGIEFSGVNQTTFLSSALTTIRSITVTIPASGFVTVHFDTQTFINHVLGSANGITCQLQRNGSFARSRSWNTDDGDDTGGRNRSLHLMYTRPETTAGSVEYAVLCTKGNSTVTAQVANYELTATYYQHRY